MVSMSDIENPWIKLGDFIRNYRKKNEMSAYYICKVSGFSESYWSMIENGKRPNLNPEVLQKIAKILEINYHYLYEIVGYTSKNAALEYSLGKNNPMLSISPSLETVYELPKTTDICHLRKSLRPLAFLHKEDDDGVDIRVLPSIAAGSGRVLDFDDSRIERISSTFFRTGMVGFDVVGDSMSPEIPNGSVVIVMPDTPVLHKHVGVFCIDGEYVVKEYYEDKDGIKLRSSNKEYPDINIGSYIRSEAIGAVVFVILPENK